MYSCTLNKSVTTNELSLPISGFTASIYESIGDVSNEWNSMAGNNIFMRSGFLSALEETPPSGTSYKYVLVKKEDRLVGIVYFQVKKINLYKSLRLDVAKPEGLWNKIAHFAKSMLARPLKANLLVLGNMTLTGSNGFVFAEEIEEEEGFKLAKYATEEVLCYLKKQKTRVAAILIKDYYEDRKFSGTDLGYTEFKVQPNMILDVDQEWSNFDDYLSSMKSKYRVRVRRARKKAVGLEKRVMTLEDIHANSARISELYRNVANQAGFNLFILPQNYFYSLQKHLKDRMKLVGYFKGDELVGYYTHIQSHGDLDAHFLGYEPNCNRENQLYLNMLYDLVNDAIQLNSKQLIMSRTALEIKSSVGAVAHPMVLYIKANNSILNLGVARAMNYFKPKNSWVARSPFK